MKHQKLATTSEISNRMSHVKLKRNKYEISLAKTLWHMGYRYRLNYKEIPGSPDIAVTKYHIAIFVDGEFWHGKNFEKKKNNIHNNKEFWIEKINENIQRDIRNDMKLKAMGWIPLHFWSKDIEKSLSSCIDIIEDFVNFQSIGQS